MLSTTNVTFNDKTKSETVVGWWKTECPAVANTFSLEVIVKTAPAGTGLTIKNQSMRKVIAAINMTLDGFCDHTAGIPDKELHQHYTDLLNNADIVLYGRITYQLMEYWQPFVKNPSGEKSMDDFALAIDRIQKIIFSHTLKKVEWATAKLANRAIEEEVLELKQRSGKNILVGSRSVIIQLLNSNLIDEFQICIHPVLEGKGLPLFDQIKDRIIFNLIKTTSLNSGATVLYYETTLEKQRTAD